MGEKAIRVLLVEDNPGDARLLRETLRDVDQAFDWTHVERLAEAIKCLGSHEYDVLLLDLSLPDSEGTDAVKRLTAVAPHLPVVVLTGTDDEAVATEAVRGGAQDYLVKGQSDHRLLTRAIRYAIERKRGETALRISEEHLRLYLTVLQSAANAIAITATDGTIQWINAAFTRLTGYSAAEAIGQNPRVLKSGRHPPEFYKEIWRTIASGGVWHGELVNRRKDGSLYSEEMTITPVRSATGQVTHFIAIKQDISARKRSEEELAAAKVAAEQAKAAAEAASKAKDHFLAVLSHELRNPLNPVLATASMLRDDPRFDQDTREQLEVICRNAELEARLIDDLLDVTRIERGKIELDRGPHELGTIIRRAVEVCMPDIDARKLEFGVQLGPVPYWVDADAARLQQVFWNLLKNAVKFTPKGGCVGLRCREDGDGVVVEVSDSGVGIEAEAMGRIFNAFEQAERSITRQFGGLGLGLAISKALVEMHGGTIQAQSAGYGRGATFSVRLPRLTHQGAMAPPQATAQSPAAGLMSQAVRILLVEDHGDTARIMRRVLSADGHDVVTAADVATALKLATSQHFDLLLSDLGLPDGSGVDLMRALRAKGIALPGIALSGFGQETDVKQSQEAGFLIHLTKPVNLAKLSEAMTKAVGGRQAPV